MRLDDEQPLSGGNVSDGVVRVGDTARRPVGPWTPAVHALLAHLHAVGSGAAPRPLGIDDQGREVLTFMPGDVVWPDRFSL
ncbi:aminoglycoside phosphotransferase family protein, partial [Streptomyces sp. NPDC048179]